MGLAIVSTVSHRKGKGTLGVRGSPNRNIEQVLSPERSLRSPETGSQGRRKEMSAKLHPLQVVETWRQNIGMNPGKITWVGIMENFAGTSWMG